MVPIVTLGKPFYQRYNHLSYHRCCNIAHVIVASFEMQAEIALSYGRAEMQVSTTLIFGTLVSWYSDTLISIGTLLFRT